MDKLIVIESCDDGMCCCLIPRTSVIFIAIISLTATLLDVLLSDGEPECCAVRQNVHLLRSTLVTFFQKANILLLLGSVVESALLVQIYLWYALAFIVMGFVVSIMDFLFRFKEEGAMSFVGFVTEIAFLFVIFRCLSLVDIYRKRLEIT